MTDRDRIIDAFRNCITEPKCKDCPWDECDTLNNRCAEIPIDLALAVMQELVAQEPKPPLVTENAYGWKFYHCPKCGREFYADRVHGRVNAVKFCDKCGQEVKWDD